MSTLTTPSQCYKARESNKRRTDWKGRNKTVFVKDMMTYVDNPKEFAEKLLEIICEFGKARDYKVKA